jgi:hypothetical protein
MPNHRIIPLAATFATKWVNTKLLDYVPENKTRVRNEFDA